MKAVFETGGKQYYAKVGDVLYLEKLDGNADDKVTFENVLMIDEKTGNPYIKGAKVEAKIVKQGKAKKIIVYKFKAKKKYRRTQGHRQPYTKVEITKISEK
ncbi:MAG: 50S ribosomal protein L21 [Bacilli bacterium]|nr:50S ribosomal protein L21 [Bacilli bacterium]MBR3362319.1 50S ribosomal protein L21 [Bacilli bacterium]